MLGLRAKTGAMRVRFPVFACSAAIQEDAAIKLDARFGGQHIQDSPAGSFEYFGSHLQAASLALCKHPIVIVPPSTHAYGDHGGLPTILPRIALTSSPAACYY